MNLDDSDSNYELEMKTISISRIGQYIGLLLKNPNFLNLLDSNLTLFPDFTRNQG